MTSLERIRSNKGHNRKWENAPCLWSSSLKYNIFEIQNSPLTLQDRTTFRGFCHLLFFWHRWKSRFFSEFFYKGREISADIVQIFKNWLSWSQRLDFGRLSQVCAFSNKINAHHLLSQSHQNRLTCILFLAPLFLDEFLYCKTILLNLLEVIWI